MIGTLLCWLLGHRLVRVIRAPARHGALRLALRHDAVCTRCGLYVEDVYSAERSRP